MSNRPPQDIAARIKAIIYQAADREKYMAMSRPESGRFMDDLVRNPAVGGILESFIPKQEIRTYIKDSVLNRYTKDKAGDAYALEFDKLIFDIFNSNSIFIEKKGDIFLFKSIQNAGPFHYYVISKGTFLKWETALRKALLFISTSPFSNLEAKIDILLVLYTQGKVITPSDERLLKTSLKICGAIPYFVGD